MGMERASGVLFLHRHAPHERRSTAMQQQQQGPGDASEDAAYQTQRRARIAASGLGNVALTTHGTPRQRRPKEKRHECWPATTPTPTPRTVLSVPACPTGGTVGRAPPSRASARKGQPGRYTLNGSRSGSPIGHGPSRDLLDLGPLRGPCTDAPLATCVPARPAYRGHRVS